MYTDLFLTRGQKKYHVDVDKALMGMNRFQGSWISSGVDEFRRTVTKIERLHDVSPQTL